MRLVGIEIAIGYEEVTRRETGDVCGQQIHHRSDPFSQRRIIGGEHTRGVKEIAVMEVVIIELVRAE